MTDVERRALERLRAQLYGWVPFIKRATFAAEAVWYADEESLRCIVRWTKNKPELTHSIPVSRIFGSASDGEPLEQPCVYAKEVVRTALGYQ